ncbi:hypothetical protein PsorP6_016198 [Peronosclerospora sorghi]|uniref:Uncharacterized protein n=1 Tax=Peronosclerospora sorghi TaxID=230839 RepID=A0ACC0VNY0_9STRA|nr:hypothetical protein PsorP6_016198 [Peronosclerospora sorghi]
MISYLISKLNRQKLLRSFVIAIGQGAKPLRNKRSSIRTTLLQHVQVRHKLVPPMFILCLTCFLRDECSRYCSLEEEG